MERKKKKRDLSTRIVTPQGNRTVGKNKEQQKRYMQKKKKKSMFLDLRTIENN